MLDSICRAAGLRTGLFTSPHLRSITERIKIDGQEISKQLSRAWRPQCDRGDGAAGQRIDAACRPFEQVTAIALLAFAEARVDLAILETGWAVVLTLRLLPGWNCRHHSDRFGPPGIPR